MTSTCNVYQQKIGIFQQNNNGKIKQKLELIYLDFSTCHVMETETEASAGKAG